MECPIKANASYIVWALIFAPLRIIKEFSEIFLGFLAENFHEYLEKGFFPDELKCPKVVPVYEKKITRIRITTDLSVFFLGQTSS